MRKIERALDLAGVGSGTRVLEIGCGWGRFCDPGSRRGVTVRAVTISHQQWALTEQRVRAAGVSNRVRVELQDYRETGVDSAERYDAILSIEMIEAVGERYWPTYFKTLDRCLAPEGRIVLQAITMRHDRLVVARRTHNWINKYIFPGGLAPSFAALENVMEVHTELRVISQRSFADHSCRHTACLAGEVRRNADALERLGDHSTFRRTWILYFSICEAGFRSGFLDVNSDLDSS